MWLIDRIKDYRNKDALVFEDKVYRYRDIIDFRDTYSDLLKRNAVGSGTIVALIGDFSPRTCGAFLALLENRSILVPLTPAVYAKRKEFLDIAEVQFVLKPDISNSLQPHASQVRNQLSKTLIERKDAGLILFSSGSTGESKAALHALSPMLDKFRTPRQAMRTLLFLLFDHIGGINTFFHILANGGVLVLPTGRTPEAVCRTIEKYRVELLPTSPTFLNLLLLSEAYQRHNLSSLKRITYGTEPMPESTLKRLAEVFPGVTLQQTYGLSEVGILRSKSKGNDSLWVRVGGEEFETKVVDGILWIRAQSAMLGYLNAPSPFDRDGWFNTEDAVEVQGEYVRFLGRQSEVINVGGEKVYPAEVECHLLGVENISDAVVFAEPNPITGQMVVASVNLIRPEPLQDVKKRIRMVLKATLESFKIPQKVVIAEQRQFSDRYKRRRTGPLEDS